MSDNHFISWEAAVLWLRSQPDKRALVEACYYDQPLEAAAKRYHQSVEWRGIREVLPKNLGSVLDIGAGHGITSYALATDGWQVSALEPYASEEVGAGAIRRLAAGGNLPIQVVQEFGEEIPFPSASFDVVFARQTLHHAKDLSKFCVEVARVLKPRGRFFAIRDHVISKREDLARFLEIHPLHRYYGGENAFLLEEYKQAFKSAGLELKQALRPLESPINYAPHSEATLREDFIERVVCLPMGRVIGWFLRSSLLAYHVGIKLAILLDNRPGRTYSFICEKKESER